MATRNALRKAEAGAAKRPGETVLGIDTVVVLDGEIFAKPAGERAAETTLKRLSGRTHEVVSGLALLRPGNPQVVHEVTKVTFGSSTRSSFGGTFGRVNGPAVQAVMPSRAKALRWLFA